MCDVFVSYAREDLAFVEQLASILKGEGLSIWFDKHLVAGESIRSVITERIQAAGKVVVLWSRHSIGSHWVLGEASMARALNKLVPARLDDVTAPIDFGHLNTVDLSDWTGHADHSAFKLQLLPALRIRSPKTTAPRETQVINLPFGKANDHPLKPGNVFHDGLEGGRLGPKLVVIPAGRFVMGSPVSEERRQPNEGPQHEVRIPKPFAIGAYPVTFTEFDAYCAALGEPPPGDEGWGRGQRPVIHVSWGEAVAFCHWLSDKTGRCYRLTSEAEWEYACRAGSNTRYAWGDQPGQGRALCDGCCEASDRQRTTSVGQFPANAFGLFDMHGNVFEWCQDRWHSTYAGAPGDGSAWELGGSNERVARGGSWLDQPQHLRSANRYKYQPHDRFDFLGFRVVRDI
ncbi:MAG: SUMF1/EgtB/PvdO family nonheme iron enzyme [Thiotrichales bacterium]